jgi:hypothetical protein
MTARELQQAVVDDIRELLAPIKYDTPGGNQAAPSIFKQSLPKKQAEDEDDPFPYVIVRLDTGGVDSPTDPHKVAMILLVGIYDESPENNGHEAVLEIIEKIQTHYQQNPALKQFAFTDPSTWVLQDEESWPYFFGACNLTFNAPAPRVKWSDLV